MNSEEMTPSQQVAEAVRVEETQALKEAMPSMANVPVPPKPKLCVVTKIIPQHILDMLKIAPDNPQLRTMIHAKILVPLPDEAKTYEQIVQWIEEDVNPATIKPSEPDPNVVVARQEARQPQFCAEVRYSEKEVGRCSYTRKLTGTGEYELNRNRIREIAENSDNFSDFVERLEAEFETECDECPPDTDEVGDNDYYDHEADESQNRHSECIIGANELRDWMMQHLPDHLETLDNP